MARGDGAKVRRCEVLPRRLTYLAEPGRINMICHLDVRSSIPENPHPELQRLLLPLREHPIASLADRSVLPGGNRREWRVYARSQRVLAPPVDDRSVGVGHDSDPGEGGDDGRGEMLDGLVEVFFDPEAVLRR